MAEALIAEWDVETDVDVPVKILSDVLLVRDESGKLDGEVEVIYISPLIPNFTNIFHYREHVVRQTPSNIIRGEE